MRGGNVEGTVVGVVWTGPPGGRAPDDAEQTTTLLPDNSMVCRETRFCMNP